MKVGIQEALSGVASLEFLQALCRTDGEAQAEHERQKVMAEINSRDSAA